MATPPASADEEVQYTVANGVATVVLNRPRALNSLNTFMVERLLHVFTAWAGASTQQEQQQQQQQPAVTCVLIKGTGDKAFCAGGDIKWVAEEARAGRVDGPVHFFATEYRLNHQIACMPLPYIALMDGVVMGGGAGVSVHGHFRVVTERTVFAMPECAIGLFPDIGASSFLQRLPGKLGLWLGLTGARLKGIDVRTAGLATHYIPSQLLPEVETRLQRLAATHAARTSSTAGSAASSVAGSAGCAAGSAPPPMDLSEVNQMLSDLEAEVGPPPPGALEQQLPWINRHFAGASVPAILGSLGQRQRELQGRAAGAEAAWLEETMAGMARGSPLSECVTLELFKRARHMTLEQCLALDLKLARRFVAGQADFVEGVTALLVDRGRSAIWKYASVQEVPEPVVQAFFEEQQERREQEKPRSPASRM